MPRRATSDMRALVVINPASGGNAAESLLPILNRLFGAAGIAYEILETREGAWPGAEVAARVAAGFDLAVAAGGDGTVAAVIHGLVGTPIALGIIPLGTGNQVARELGLPLDAEAAVALLAGAHRRRRIDAMRIGGRIYVLNASVGISASVVGDTTRRTKALFGRLAYVGATVLRVLQSKSRRLKIAVDGRKSRQRAVEAVVMNCGHLARMLYPREPAVCVDDGHLDVWVLRARTVFDFPGYFIDLLLRRPARPMAAHFAAVNSVVIRSKRPLPVQADGDIIGTTPVTIELLPAALTVLVPE